MNSAVLEGEEHKRDTLCPFYAEKIHILIVTFANGSPNFENMRKNGPALPGFLMLSGPPLATFTHRLSKLPFEFSLKEDQLTPLLCGKEILQALEE